MNTSRRSKIKRERENERVKQENSGNIGNRKYEVRNIKRNRTQGKYLKCENRGRREKRAKRGKFSGGQI